MARGGGFHIKVVEESQRDLDRAFRQIRKDTQKEMRPALMRAAEPVRADAASRFGAYDTRSAAGYKVRVRLKGVAVEQSLRRTTGQHPSYGSLQMRRALLPALASKGDQVRHDIEVMVDMVGVKAGF